MTQQKLQSSYGEIVDKYLKSIKFQNPKYQKRFEKNLFYSKMTVFIFQPQANDQAWLTQDIITQFKELENLLANGKEEEAYNYFCNEMNFQPMGRLIKVALITLIVISAIVFGLIKII